MSDFHTTGKEWLQENQWKRQKKELQKNKPKRKIPFFFRALAILLLLLMSMTMGMMVGYGHSGKYEMVEVLDTEVWKHIWNLVFEGTKK